MSARILICIPVHNRLEIARRCVPTVSDGIGPHDQLVVFDDGTTEDNPEAWQQIGTRATTLVPVSTAIGIERQRRRHFEYFAMRPTFTHLYLTDADALHDPAWALTLLAAQDAHGGAPICGYNTEAHVRIPGNTIIDDPASNVIWRRVAPGISYLLTREHAEKVLRWLRANPQVEHWNWDWQVPAILGNRFAVLRQSVVDHIGFGGYHHPPGAGLDEGDRALNPTEWLVAKRAEVVAELSKK